jgi:hypothetical protein
MYPPAIGIAFFIVIFSVVGVIYSLYKYLVLRKLRKKKIPLLAHWFYSPHYSPFIQDFLKETRDRRISIAILLGLFGLLFLFGIVIAYETPLLYIVILTVLLLFLCVCICLLFHYNYQSSLKKQSEILIGQKQIYFCNTLFGLRKGSYFLLNVTLSDGKSPYLVFRYGYPYADSHLSYDVYIPVPHSQLALAKHIVNHYNVLVGEQ